MKAVETGGCPHAAIREVNDVNSPFFYNLGQNLLRQTRFLNSITLTTPKSLKHAFSPRSPRPML